MMNITADDTELHRVCSLGIVELAKRTKLQVDWAVVLRLTQFSITAILIFVFLQTPQNGIVFSMEESPEKTRWVVFSKNLSMSTLYLRTRSEVDYVPFLHPSDPIAAIAPIDKSWQKFGQAQGEITVPEGAELKLVVDRFVSDDLSPLTQLDPDDIQYLDLTYLNKEEELVHIKHLTGLLGINLQNTWITDVGMAYLSGFSNLSELKIDATYITNDGLAHLSNLGNLKKLSLRDINSVSDAGLKHLAGLTSLEALILPYTISDNGLAYLNNLAKLKELDLQNANITDAGLVHLKTLKSLEILDLSGTRISHEGLVHLIHLTKLKTLNLYGTRMTVNDRGLSHLNKLTALELLIFPQPVRPSAEEVSLPPHRTDIPTPRYDLSISVVKGKIYTIGGRSDGDEALNTTEVYDPATETWSPFAPMPTPRYRLSTSVVAGKIYAIGGTTGSSVLATVEVYNPVTNTWTSKASMPTPRQHLSTGVVDGRVYAIGGVKGTSTWGSRTILSTVEVYDPVADTWTPKASLPTARAMLSTSVISRKIYAIGGYRETNAAFVTTEVYDPDADKWTKAANLLIPRSWFATCTIDGKIYAIGGWLVDNAVTKTVEVYDSVQDIWTKIADFQIPRGGHGACAINGKIYVIGGANAYSSHALDGGFAPVSTIEVYDPTEETP